MNAGYVARPRPRPQPEQREVVCCHQPRRSRADDRDAWTVLWRLVQIAEQRPKAAKLFISAANAVLPTREYASEQVQRVELSGFGAVTLCNKTL